MASFPSEVAQNIVLLSVDDLYCKEREERSRLKGRLARINKQWWNVVYGTGELWDSLFVHSRMSMRHLKHICERAEETDRRLSLHISTEDEEEFGAEDLRGLDTVHAVGSWSLRAGAFLATVVLEARSVRINSMNPHCVFLILQNTGMQQALQIDDLRCYVTLPTANDFNYLQPMVSQRLETLCLSRVNLRRLPTIQMQTITTLRLFYLLDQLDWIDFRAILLAFVALQELELADISCGGDLGTAPLTLLTVRELSLDLSGFGGLELANILDVPNIEKLTVRGEFDAPWKHFVVAFRGTLRLVKRCALCAEAYTQDLANLLHELRAVEIVDIRTSTSDFLRDLARGPINPPRNMRRLREWIVPSDVFYSQIRNLFDWPDCQVEVIYEETEDDEQFEGMVLKWVRLNNGFSVDLVHANP
ncbi:hypothetical protein R3P38DRAFT_3229680 [Favolaschia claudopus]|uniref:F-box domain-containing protein n=1 Tax=Favolaschia claudopus TaxID=2862362 RepID=A0AAV9ZNH9_9AGAR